MAASLNYSVMLSDTRVPPYLDSCDIAHVRRAEGAQVVDIAARAARYSDATAPAYVGPLLAASSQDFMEATVRDTLSVQKLWVTCALRFLANAQRLPTVAGATVVAPIETAPLVGASMHISGPCAEIAVKHMFFFLKK